MTAAQKLMQLILHRATGTRHDTAAAVADAWGELSGTCELGDAVSEVRGGECVTGLPCDYSRHYESKAVAARMLDGSWVGWTYWFGGGKHGEPSAVPWIEDAYDVVMTEETQVVKVFRRPEPATVAPPGE